MKKFLIVSLFGDPLSENNSRLNNIYDNADAEKLIVTSDFDHGRKEYRVKGGQRKVVYLHVPSYKKNLSLKRIFSHICFAYELKKFLRSLKEKPDIIYCAMPTATAAWVCGRYSKKNNIRFVVDVIDLWPDSLIPVNKYFKLFRFILYPWKVITITAYKKANIILGESRQYTAVAHHYNPLAPFYTIYLGIDSRKISSLMEISKIQLTKEPDEIWICYGGSLGNSYDFDALLDAVKGIVGCCKYKLWFVGGGENQEYIERKIKTLELNAYVTGEVSYPDYLKYLSYCDIGINIFKQGTLVVHSYKFNDYVACRLFILNSLEGETAHMVEEYQIGCNFNFDDKPLALVLKQVCMNWERYKNGRHAQLIEEKMEKEKIYKPVLSQILS